MGHVHAVLPLSAIVQGGGHICGGDQDIVVAGSEQWAAEMHITKPGRHVGPPSKYHNTRYSEIISKNINLYRSLFS